jgi:hypothetical protein
LADANITTIRRRISLAFHTTGKLLLLQTVGTAAVSSDYIPIIAFFARLDDAVTAGTHPQLCAEFIELHTQRLDDILVVTVDHHGYLRPCHGIIRSERTVLVAL